MFCTRHNAKRLLALAGRGFALGVMVGALTLGSAMPHLVLGFGGINYKVAFLCGFWGIAQCCPLCFIFFVYFIVGISLQMYIFCVHM